VDVFSRIVFSTGQILEGRGRACPGHPRLIAGLVKKDMDARDQPGMTMKEGEK